MASTAKPDRHRHKTPAGTIAASVNGQGVVGVAPNVQIMSLKVFAGITVTGKMVDAQKAVLAARPPTLP